jgi:hypothetical protein
MRRGVPILVLTLVFACDRKGATQESPDQATSAVGGGPVAGPTLLPGATCAFPDKIETDHEIAPGCIVDVRRGTFVSNGATLTVGPGVTLRFHPTAYLEIGHRGSRLVARGTESQPIVFTSAAEQKAPGDWVGIVFDQGVGQGSVIENAVVEYGGRASHGGQGAITVLRRFEPGRVGLRGVTFRKNATAAIADVPGALFAPFDGNAFEQNARGLRLSAAAVSAIGPKNRFDDPIEVVGGTVTGVGTWPKPERGYEISEPIYVNGEGDKTASLTIAKGAVLKFANKTWLEVGTGGPAELVAQGVTFTTLAEPVRAGEWVGLLFGDHTKHARISSSVIEGAGAEEHGGDAAVTFVGTKSWQALDVHFGGVVFKKIAQAHFSSNGDGCETKALDPKQGIVWAGLVEPCR